MLQVTSSEFRGKFDSVPSHIFEARPAADLDVLYDIVACISNGIGTRGLRVD